MRRIGLQGLCRVYVGVIKGCIIANIKGFPKGLGSQWFLQQNLQVHDKAVAVHGVLHGVGQKLFQAPAPHQVSACSQKVFFDMCSHWLEAVAEA